MNDLEKKTDLVLIVVFCFLIGSTYISKELNWLEEGLCFNLLCVFGFIWGQLVFFEKGYT